GDVPGSGEGGEFERLLAEQGPGRFTRVAAGDRVKGTVVGITSAAVLVDIGQRSEAFVPLDEVRPEDRERLRVGDRAEFLVSRVSGAGVELSWSVVAHKLDLSRIQDAMQAGIPIDGKVSGENKGGFSVDLPGARGFVPFSQMELGPAHPAADYIGRTFRFRVLEVRGKDVILSRAALLREEREREQREVLAKLAPGQELEAEVVKVERFGAFIDLGAGIHALVPISEMAWSSADEVLAMLRPGFGVRVRILEIGKAGGKPRISASMKRITADPWDSVAARFAVGQVVQGRVTRLAPFGAFLEIGPGVEGLVHISEMSSTKHVQSPHEVVKPGDEVEAVIIAIDAAARRIGLSMAQVPDAAIDPELRAKYVQGPARAPASPGSTPGSGLMAEAFEKARLRAEKKKR
ncbi:MAG: S1 RNA-binding domain-containing protein, partial [Acidobacteria bacterium]|nr:S1 RNA-binding domain-containing protein [Acidobacteriota bacterium]